MTTRPVLAAVMPAATFVVWFPLIALAPFLVLAAPHFWPTGLENVLFFLPQAVFPYNTFTAAPPHPGPRVWPGLWVVYWIIVGAAFYYLTRRFRSLRAFLLAGPTIFLCTLVLQLLISAFGLYFELDGP